MGDVSPHEYFDRQLRVPGWGVKGQKTLDAATVLVVGVGGLGCPVLASLSRGGVGTLIFCDPDFVETSNLPRQTLFGVADVGTAKVVAAERTLRAGNPWVTLHALEGRVDASNVRELVEAADVVVDGTDNFATKFLLHDACRSAGRPFVMASLYQWEAQMTAFDFRRAEPGCWRCLYPVPPEDGCVGVCADVGVAGALASLAGHAQALTVLRLLLGLSTTTGCSTLIWDVETSETHRFGWKPLPDCDCGRARGDWSWLTELSDQQPNEAPWDAIEPAERQVVVDLREPHEVQGWEWDWFVAQGSAVVQARWAAWDEEAPAWKTGVSYVLVCAAGVRSLAALKTVPANIRAISLQGGVAGLRPRLAGSS